jgi:hypothetical protein
MKIIKVFGYLCRQTWVNLIDAFKDIIRLLRHKDC